MTIETHRVFKDRLLLAKRLLDEIIRSRSEQIRTAQKASPVSNDQKTLGVGANSW